MAINPTKSKSSYKVEMTETTPPSTLIVTSQNNTSENYDSEQKVAVADPDSSKRFKILSKHGISPLKAVLLASTEFVPIGTGKPDARNTIKVSIGAEGAPVAVTQVAKLMELHRQIRRVTIRSANKLLMEAKGYDVDAFYRHASTLIRQNYGKIADQSIEKTVENAIKLLKNPSMYKFKKAVTVKDIQAAVRASVVRAAAGRRGSSSDSSDSESDESAYAVSTVSSNNESKSSARSGSSKRKRVRKRSATVRQITRKYETDPFFRTMVEYIVHGVLVVDILKYLGGLLRIKEKLGKNYSLREMSGDYFNAHQLGMPDNILNGMNRIMRRSFKTGRDRHEQFRTGFIEEVIDNALNVQTHKNSDLGEVGDAQFALQAMISTMGHISLYGSKIGQSAAGMHFKEKIKPKICVNPSIENDIWRGMMSVRNISEFGMIRPWSDSRGDTDLQSGVLRSPGVTHEINLKEALGVNPQKEVTREEKGILGHFDPMRSPSGGSVFGEYLVASLIDTMYTIRRVGLKSHSKGKALRRLGSGKAYGTSFGIKEYFEELLGLYADPIIIDPDSEGFDTDGNRKSYPSKINERRNFRDLRVEKPRKSPGSEHGLFVNKFYKIDTIDNKDYVALESNESTAGAYQTGPEIFIDHALQTGDETFQNGLDFTNDYLEFAEDFYSDITKLTGIMKVESVFRKMCGDLADEFEKIGGSPDLFEASLLNMALLLSGEVDEKNKFTSAWFGTKTWKATEVSGPTDGRYVNPHDRIYPFMTSELRDYSATVTVSPESAAPQPPGARLQNQADIDKVSNKVIRMAAKRAVRFETDEALGDFILDLIGWRSRHSMQQTEVWTDSNGVKQGKDEWYRVDGTPYQALLPEKYVTWDRDFSKLSSAVKIGSPDGGSGAKNPAGDYALDGDVPPPPPPGQSSQSMNTGNNWATFSYASDYIIKRYSGDWDLNPEQELLERGIKFTRAKPQAMLNFSNFKCFEEVFPRNLNRTKFINQLPNFIATGNQVTKVPKTSLPFSPEHLFAEEVSGEFFELANVHRCYIYYQWVRHCMEQCMTIKAWSKNNAGERNAAIGLRGFHQEMLGMASAFRIAAEGGDLMNIPKKEKRIFNEESRGRVDRSQAYLKSQAKAASYIQQSIKIIRHKERMILGSAMTFALHAVNLNNSIKEFARYVREGDDGKKRTKLAINMLKQGADFESTIDLISKESLGQMLNSHVNTLVSVPNNIFTPEEQMLKRKMKLCFKVLTTPGYGLLKSEKRGNKTVLHVGITNSMLATLRSTAYRETKNRKFLESTNIAINVFKKNELNAAEALYPKVIAFDTSAYIHDYNTHGLTRDHIRNFKEDWSFQEVLDNLVVTRFSAKLNKSTKKLNDNKLGNDYKIVNVQQKTATEDRTLQKDILINHALDYALKGYYKFALGVDLNEYNFPLDSSLNSLPGQAGGFINAAQDMQTNYDDFINQLVALYPAANVDQELAMELFRHIETIGKTPVYTLGNRFKKVVQPKKFDRIFSFLVNDKDFIIHPDSVNKDFGEIYRHPPNFSYTSRIAQRDIGAGRFVSDNNFDPGEGFKSIGYRTKNSSILEKYKKSCNEDYPEVFSYYVTISLLTDDAFADD